MGAPAERQRAAHLAEIEQVLGNPILQETIRTRQNNRQSLQQAAGERPDWQVWKEAVADLRSHTVAHLDGYLEQFADDLERRGGQVYFAANATEATEYIVPLARAKDVRVIVKAKSMLSEEIGLNRACGAQPCGWGASSSKGGCARDSFVVA